MTDEELVWPPCDMCDNFWCNIHNMHEHECECEGHEWWDKEFNTSPYEVTLKQYAEWKNLKTK